jgi:hypothetical protein
VIVQSRTFRSIGYDPSASVLELEFQSGSVYQYLNVPRSVFEELLAAPSKGAYFNQDIRPVYDYRDIGGR